MTEPSAERLNKDVRRVLKNPFWIGDLKSDTVYERLHDDHDGTEMGRLMVQIDSHGGDAFITIDGNQTMTLRFREQSCGGGRSPRTRNALMILALAMKLDEEEFPEP